MADVETLDVDGYTKLESWRQERLLEILAAHGFKVPPEMVVGLRREDPDVWRVELIVQEGGRVVVDPETETLVTVWEEFRDRRHW